MEKGGVGLKNFTNINKIYIPTHSSQHNIGLFNNDFIFYTYILLYNIDILASETDGRTFTLNRPFKRDNFHMG